jgi:hypothetical protein
MVADAKELSSIMSEILLRTPPQATERTITVVREFCQRLGFVVQTEQDNS